MARIKHGTLTANTVTAVEVDGSTGSVEVSIVDNPAPIYFRVDGIDPVVGGDDSQVVTAGIGASLSVDLPEHYTIKLISAGTPDYCVRGV